MGDVIYWSWSRVHVCMGHKNRAQKELTFAQLDLLVEWALFFLVGTGRVEGVIKFFTTYERGGDARIKRVALRIRYWLYVYCTCI